MEPRVFTKDLKTRLLDRLLDLSGLKEKRDQLKKDLIEDSLSVVRQYLTNLLGEKTLDNLSKCRTTLRIGEVKQYDIFLGFPEVYSSVLINKEDLLVYGISSPERIISTVLSDIKVKSWDTDITWLPGLSIFIDYFKHLGIDDPTSYIPNDNKINPLSFTTSIGIKEDLINLHQELAYTEFLIKNFQADAYVYDKFDYRVGFLHDIKTLEELEDSYPDWYDILVSDILPNTNPGDQISGGNKKEILENLERNLGI